MAARLLGAVVLLVALNAPAAAASCGIPVGRSVTLKSTALDPDVFVWDARQRVIDYADGYWRNTSDVLAHTLLAKPGTRAVIIQCAAGVIRGTGEDAGDAIGIRIVNGPNKGRYGWITSEDVYRVAER